MNTQQGENYKVEGGLVSSEKDGKSWTEPLANYDGVLWHEETVSRHHRSGGKRRRNSVFQIIELRHNNNHARNLILYNAVETKGVRALWEQSARDFNLPALRNMGDGKILRREPEDLDKSLRQLGREGKLDCILDAGPKAKDDGIPDLRPQEDLDPETIRERMADAARAFTAISANEIRPSDYRRSAPDGVSHNWDQYFKTEAPVPTGMSWQYVGETLDIRVRKSVIPYILAGIPAALFTMFVGYMVPAEPFNTVVVISLLGLLYWLWISISYRVVVTSKYVRVSRWLGPVPLFFKTIPLDEIEEIVIGQAFLSSASILVESDRRSLRVAPLSDEGAEWLSWFLRAAIVTAPEA